MLESCNMILYCDSSTVTDKTVISADLIQCSKTETEQNNTCNRNSSSLDLPKTEAEKIMKYKNLAMEIKKNIYVIYPLSHLSGKSGHQNFIKHLENIALTKKKNL